MPEQVTNYQCPACTGPLHFDSTLGKLKCDFCESVFETAEIEKMYADANRRAAEASAQAAKAHKKAEEQAAQDQAMGAESSQEWNEAGMHAYNCTACGAELVCDANTAATSCPYCGNPAIIPGQFSGMLKPDYVIPFARNKQDAVNTLTSYYKGKLLLPGSFTAGNHIEEVKGVYVPFWLYNGSVDARASYRMERRRVMQQGDVEITQTEHFTGERSGTLRFSGIPVDASTHMPDDLMDSIEPYNYKELKPFSMAYMPGYLADKYDVSQDKCRDRARERAVNTARSALFQTVTGYTSVNVTGQEERIHSDKVQYAMLPVWLLSTRWDNKNYLFAMNGQSGQMIGDLPVSTPKLAAWFLGVFAAVCGLVYLMSEELTYGLIGGLIVAAITVLVLQSQMKPVARKHSAERYVEEGGLQLHRKEDTYLNTTETRRTIQRVDPQAKPGGTAGTRPGGQPGSQAGNRPGGRPAGRPTGHGGSRPK